MRDGRRTWLAMNCLASLAVLLPPHRSCLPPGAQAGAESPLLAPPHPSPLPGFFPDVPQAPDRGGRRERGRRQPGPSLPFHCPCPIRLNSGLLV